MRPSIDAFTEAPAHGEHTAAVLAEAGLSADDVARLERRGAVRSAS